MLGLDDPGKAARAGVLSKAVKNEIRDVTDGTSNSIILSRMRRAAGRRNADLFTLYTDDKIVTLDGSYAAADGTGWADPDCGFSINGATVGGLDKYGPYMINRINVSEVFSFHLGGAQVALADGSARFVSENIDTHVFAGACTRSCGEVIGEW